MVIVVSRADVGRLESLPLRASGPAGRHFAPPSTRAVIRPGLVTSSLTIHGVHTLQ